MCCQGEEMYWLVDGRVGGQSSQFLFLAIHHRGFGGEVLKRSFHSRPYISRFVLFDVGFAKQAIQVIQHQQEREIDPLTTCPHQQAESDGHVVVSLCEL
ncbi:hypothetical protein I3843_02G064900 [Carya illinoinensis]|nr:hypothetical protein I3843_02G064900 [Carya illinoinensis]